MKLSVIVPALDEEAEIAATLARARQPGVHEIIVVDGGSHDGTMALAQRHAERVITAAAGRATQMNAGAAVAAGDTFLFLHADTWLPDGFVATVAAALSDPAIVGGRFDVDLTPTTPLLRLVGELMNLRSRLSGIATGDQAIFVRRECFEALGGFAAMPLMEDIDFCQRLRRAGRIACLRQRVATSSRRWLAAGPIRTILLMWTLRLLFFLGVSPATLRRVYADLR